MKYIIMIMDGAADNSLQELGGKTPLQAAEKKNIDGLAVKSRCGLLRTIPEGFFTGSAVANLSILGYKPLQDFRGRGVLEAAALGIDAGDDDIVFRCNTICEEEGKIKNHSAGHITSKESSQLIDALNDQLGDMNVKFYPGFGYRHIMVLAGKFSDMLDCKPPHDYAGCQIEDILVRPKSAQGRKTADFVNSLIEKSKKILEEHDVNISRQSNGKDKANMIWPWSPGKRPDMETFLHRFGLKGAVISAVDLVKGLGIFAGFDVLEVEGATGLYDTNYEGKALACVEALRRYDFLYLHVEAPDEASHEKDIGLKIRCIEDFDRRLVYNVLSRVDMRETVIAILPDHLTSVETGVHLADPVPFLIYSPTHKGDDVHFFDEHSCSKGSLGVMEGEEFIKEVLRSGNG